MGQKRQPIREDQLHNWNLLDQFRRRVLPLLQAKAPTPTEEDVRRTLFAEDYFCSYLFAMLNPVIPSMRALCHVSHCQKMRPVCAAPISPAAFSEGQPVFDPEILEKVVRRLAKEAQSRGQGGEARVRQALSALTAVDGPVLRAVRVEANGDVFHLVTTREDLSAELIGLIYRQRWQIELFFKWIKTILNCRHWLAESPAGVQMQIYCVLIASLLLMLWTGQRPNKRMVESLQWYWMGMANEEDLVTLLERAGCAKKS